jgi:hypothetical protein
MEKKKRHHQLTGTRICYKDTNESKHEHLDNERLFGPSDDEDLNMNTWTTNDSLVHRMMKV